MAPTCSDENFNARCHQACTRHAKDSGRSITWKCPQHGTEIAEIIIPPAPIYEQPNRPSASGKSCSVCKNPIRTRYANLAYHCANPSCGVCHLAATCSGFVNPRGNARASALSTSLALSFSLFIIRTFASFIITWQLTSSPNSAIIKFSLESRLVSSSCKKFERKVC